MNTIEFAIRDGIPYAIDFLNPAPDFERDRITEFYFTHVVDRMAKLAIDRALHGVPSNPWPRWEEMLKVGAPAGFVGQPAATKATAPGTSQTGAAAVGFSPTPAKPRSGPRTS